MKTTYLTAFAVIATSLSWGQYTTAWPSTSTANTSAAGYVGIGTKATSTSTTNPSFNLHLHGTTDYSLTIPGHPAIYDINGNLVSPATSTSYQNQGKTTRIGLTNVTTGITDLDGTVIRMSDNDFYVENKETGLLQLAAGTGTASLTLSGVNNRLWVGTNGGTSSEYARFNIVNPANASENGLYIKTTVTGKYGLSVRSNALTDNAIQVMGTDGTTARFSVQASGYTEIDAPTTPSAEKLFLVKRIGTNGPKLLQLTNDGILRAREIIVDAQNWADYVFEPSYKLRSLDEIRTFIAENKHLPNVPSTSEVNENGVNLAKTDAILLEKIEELTLYLLQQDEQIKQMQAELDTLKKEQAGK